MEVNAQTASSRIEDIKIRLDNADEVPQLKNKVSFSVSNITLSEFLRGLGTSNKMNFDIDPALNNPIAVNFTNVTIEDLLIYLCDEYDMQVFINGSIISFVKYYEPVKTLPPPPPYLVNVQYDSLNQLLSFDLKDDTLISVIKKITTLTGLNLLAQQGLHYRILNGYVKGMPVEKALRELAYMNSMLFVIKDSTTFYLEDANSAKLANKEVNTSLPQGLKLTTNHIDSIISIQANNVAMKDVLASVAHELNIDYFVFSEIKGATDLKIENADFKTFLKYLFNATDYTFNYNHGVYLIGDRKLEQIRSSEVFPLKYRTVNKLVEQIPSDLKKGLEIIPLVELNSLVMAGSNPAVKELENFLRQIDKTVPVINIELFILDIRKSSSISTGIMAGIDNSKQTSTYASVFPSVDMTLSANTINNLIDGINGTGLVNLGKVTPGFYLSLKASEDNGNLKVKSTPRLATLNGNEAQMTIGETRYYAEQTTNVITTQSTTTVSGTVYKELQANFAVTIKPTVSADEQITMDISVEQSTFTEQFTKNGPYGRLTRSFKSSLRVGNNDMILLGGLDEKNTNDAGQGFPVLSRIPILKWLFSSRSSSYKNNKLAILIHPTVFY
ncbi:MAG: hypothetical protein BGO70_02770 [Bacteroidetes bacterium 43-93]|nr:MAG: hypothetical protein BGO70_02770 [Bacteroidetes bacterium 43-93]